MRVNDPVVLGEGANPGDRLVLDGILIGCVTDPQLRPLAPEGGQEREDGQGPRRAPAAEQGRAGARERGEGPRARDAEDPVPRVPLPEHPLRVHQQKRLALCHEAGELHGIAGRDAADLAGAVMDASDDERTIGGFDVLKRPGVVCVEIPVLRPPVRQARHTARRWHPEVARAAVEEHRHGLRRRAHQDLRHDGHVVGHAVGPMELDLGED
mmetsp:Transcript_113946/g.322596  ORF Transcript_113946/g.322596 Transcript_113946/m.322596 type:complete len:211 (-) Transcript_113946:99-731(-)